MISFIVARKSDNDDVIQIVDRLLKLLKVP